MSESIPECIDTEDYEGTGYFIYDPSTGRVIQKVISLGSFVTIIWGELDSRNDFVFYHSWMELESIKEDFTEGIIKEEQKKEEDTIKEEQRKEIAAVTQSEPYGLEDINAWVFVRASYSHSEWDIDWTDAVKLGDVA